MEKSKIIIHFEKFVKNFKTDDDFVNLMSFLKNDIVVKYECRPTEMTSFFSKQHNLDSIIHDIKKSKSTKWFRFSPDMKEILFRHLEKTPYIMSTDHCKSIVDELNSKISPHHRKITCDQVHTWFINTRRRTLPRLHKNSGIRPVKKRIVFDTTTTKCLEKAFDVQRKLTNELIDQLQKQCSLSKRQVVNWYARHNRNLNEADPAYQLPQEIANILEYHYGNDSYLSPHKRQSICTLYNIPVKYIEIWFYEKRNNNKTI